MKKLFSGILISLLLLTTTFAKELPILKVTAVLKNTVELGNENFNHSKYGYFSAPFSIIVKVENTSKENIHLSDGSCGYGQDWSTTNKFLSVGNDECGKNGLFFSALKPGEIKEYSLRMNVSIWAPIKDIHFRLAYFAKQSMGGFNRIAINGGPFWSND